MIVHDPQPVGMMRGAQEHGKHWIWRCHIDLSEPNPDPIERLLPLIAEYDASVWHMEQYVPAELNGHGGRQASCRPRSTRCRRRTWRSRPTTPPTSATSSGSTWTGRC